MKSWKVDLSPMQIAQITSFIKTLKGTNPSNPKEAQGEIYTEDTNTVNDSSLIKTDSLTLRPDSLNTSKK